MAVAGELAKDPQVFLFSLFLFEKFFLLKPATLYKEGPVLSHSSPLQLDWGLSRSGPITTQLSTLPCWWCPLSLWVLMAPVCLHLHLYSPPCDFKQPDLSWCCSNLVWQGSDPLTWLSPKSPAADLVGAGPGSAPSLVPALVLRTLLS